MVLPEWRAPTEFRSTKQEIDQNDEQDQRQDNLSDKAERWRKREQRNDPPGDAKHQNQNQQIDQQAYHSFILHPGESAGPLMSVVEHARYEESSEANQSREDRASRQYAG